MKFEDLQETQIYRYETNSGFAVESCSSVLPLFNADEKSVRWFDFPLLSAEAKSVQWYSFPLASQEFFSLPIGQTDIQTLWFDQDPSVSFGLADAAQQFDNFHELLHFELTNPAFNHCTDGFSFYLGSVVEKQIEFSRQCFRKRENRIVDHKQGRSLLLAGHKYLVPRCAQERTKVSAKHHTTHLEFLTLSRDHSNQNLFSAAIHKLKGFGWSIWRKYFISSHGASDGLAGILRSGPWCASSAASFGQTN
jgi:hypothetical protein